jgi:GTP:adenosylcobinamide-phosphate guanylyltransferase
MDAIVTAGGIPLPEEPLYPATRGMSKALIDVAGKPMIQWILDALSQAKTVDNIILVGMTEKSGLKCRKKIYFVPNHGGMVENLQAGGRKAHEINPRAEFTLMVSSDIPGITGEMVDWVVNTDMQTKKDVYYHVIKREVMEKRYPGCKRTWTHLKDMQICGGDMNVGRLKLLLTDETDIWRRITDSRKSPLKQAALIGFDTLFLLAARQLTLEGAEARIMKRLNITGRAIVCPYAEVGMDVDKPFQLEIMRRDLKKLNKKATPVSKKPTVPAKNVSVKKTVSPARKPIKKPALKASAKKTNKK